MHPFKKPSSLRNLLCCLPALLLFSFQSIGQDVKKFTLSFVVAGPAAKKYVKQIDSVSLRNELTGSLRTVYKLQTADSIFKVNDVEIGKYRIVVFHSTLVVPFVDFALCSACKNKVNMRAYASLAGKPVDPMAISPFYEGGFKQLSIDFLSGITPDEKKILKKSDNKMKVKCFITATGKLSDVVFDQADLPADIKALILKGFAKTNRWIPASIAGKESDDYFPVAVSKIVD